LLGGGAVSLAQAHARLRTPDPMKRTFARHLGILTVLVLAHAAAWSAPLAHGATYWGGTIKGDSYGEPTDAPQNQAVLDRFEGEAGKHVTMISTAQYWVTFDKPTMQAAIEAGAIPLVTMGLPSGVSLADVVAGNQDNQIRTWATKAKEWGYPFLFRPWWEPNGTWYTWGRNPEYVAAWRHFHDIVEEVGATNVTWAWIVNNIWSDPESNPTPYYPGDEYVDWTGMDAYNWGLNPLQPDRWLTPEQIIDPTLKILKELAPDKPVCICEDAATEMGGNKASWIHDMLHSYLPHHPEIQSYLWFNWNVPVSGGRWDWQIGSSLAATESFRDGIQSSVYLSSLPPLTKLAKVPTPSFPSTPTPPGPDPASPTLPDGHWSHPINVAAGGNDARDPQVAIGPEGIATYVWVEHNGSDYVIRERRLGPAGVPVGPVQTLSLPEQDAFDPQVVVDPRGIATVVWRRFDGSANIIQERRVLANGDLEATAHDLSAPGQFAGQPQVAAAPDGRAIVVWERYSGYRSVIEERQIYYYNTPAGTTYTLSDGLQNAVEPSVVGSATVVWDRYNGSEQIVQERRITPTGSPDTETRSLSAEGEDAIEPSLDVGQDGTVTVAWTRSEGSDQIIQAQQISQEGVPDGTVSDVSAAGGSAIVPDVAVGPDGIATLVWQRLEGSHLVVQSRRIGADGSLEPDTADLSNLSGDSYEPHVSVGGDGVASVVWDEAGERGPVIRARRVDASGEPQVQTVTLSPTEDGASAPVIAAGPGTAVMAAWRRFDGARDTVQTATFGEPQVELTPDSHDFEPLETGESFKTTFTITNIGNAELNVSSLALAGPNPDQFAVSDLGSCGDPVLPSGSCEFPVTFAPSGGGSFRADVKVLSDASSSPDTVVVTGSATDPPEPPKPPPPPPSTNTPPDASAANPSNVFFFGKPKIRMNGTATIALNLPGKGTIGLAAKGATVTLLGGGTPPRSALTATITTSGAVTLRLHAGAPTRRLLVSAGRARVSLRATFTPSGGEPRSTTLSLVLKARPRPSR
jgi:hypothetical protein